MMTVLAFVVTLGLLIVVHEYGHYRVAVACGVKVLRFSIGFGRSLWSRQRGETEFVKESAKANAKRFDDIVKAGHDATSMIADLGALRDIGGRISTGKTAEITEALGPYAEALGVKVEGLGDLQSYKAIVAKLAPRMRVPPPRDRGSTARRRTCSPDSCPSGPIGATVPGPGSAAS